MSGSVVWQRFAAGAGTFGRLSTVAIGASIPVSIALDNLLLAVVLLAWLVSAQYRDKLALAWTNPVYRAAMLLFAVLLIGTAHGDQAPGDAKLFLSKYLDLALIPVLGWAFLAPRHRLAGLRAIAGALLLVLFLSCMLKTGVIPTVDWMHGAAASPIVFKLRLTHNILMAFAAFAFAWFALAATSRTEQLAWGFASMLAVVNVTLMVDGMTGYFVLGLLLLLLSWQRARWRGIGVMTLFCAGGIILLSAIPGPFQTRTQGILHDLRVERADRPASSSAGYRMEFYRNTLALIKTNPLLGTGTGSFPAAYAELVKGTGSVAARNPHNEFMLIMVQTGIPGLTALLWLLWQQWRYAPKLASPMERGLAQGLVAMMLIVCMLNSALLDHTEGLLYAWLTALLYAGLPVRPQATGGSA